MAFQKLSAKEQKLVLQCIRATAAHVAESELHARVGLEPEELQQVITEWPNIDDADEGGDGFLAINNCLNEVCHGFKIASSDWANWFDSPEADVKAVYQRWLALRGVSGAIR